MKRFTNNQRVFVRVVARTSVLHEINAPGTVCRLRLADNGAWVSLDARHAESVVHPFPANDEYGRGTHVLAYPEGCDALRAELARSGR
jgi:hypothetical protein